MRILTSILALFICVSINAQWNKKIKGNGEIKTEKRSVSDFDKISIAGNFEVELVKGNEGEITITSDENIIEYIKTEVENGKLKIAPKDRYNLRPTSGIKMIVTFEDFEKIALAGSGSVVSDNTIKGSELKLSLAGSGTIDLKIDNTNTNTSVAGSGKLKLAGNTSNLKVSVAGSGDLKALELKASIVKVSIAGSGDVKVHAEDEIHASIAGSGDVVYSGNPKVEKSSKIGSGSFKKIQ